MCSRHGRIIRYNSPCVLGACKKVIRRSFRALNIFFAELEFLPGCALPMVFTGKAEELRDPQIVCLVVSYTDFIAKGTSFE